MSLGNTGEWQGGGEEVDFQAIKSSVLDMNQIPPPLPPGQKPMAQDAGMRLLIPVGRSIWAIMAGYLGLFSVLLVFAPPALVCGIVAIVDIRKSRLGPNPKHGMVRAIFGILMGAAGTIGLVWVILSQF